MKKVRSNGARELRALKTVRTLIAIFALIFISANCSRTAYIGTRNRRGLNNLYPNEEVDIKYPPALVVGSKFTYQDSNVSDGKTYRIKTVMAVKEKKEFENKMAYWIDVSREGKHYSDVYDINLNWIGSFSEGRELESAEPCIRVFKWPLTVGEKWSSEYTLRDYWHGVHLRCSTVAVRVRACEEVTVPAGTFEALRIEAGEETVWYAPSIGWVVKEQVGSYGNDGWLLELVKYGIPHEIAWKN